MGTSNNNLSWDSVVSAQYVNTVGTYEYEITDNKIAGKKNNSQSLKEFMKITYQGDNCLIISPYGFTVRNNGAPHGVGEMAYWGTPGTVTKQYVDFGTASPGDIVNISSTSGNTFIGATAGSNNVVIGSAAGVQWSNGPALSGQALQNAINVLQSNMIKSVENEDKETMKEFLTELLK